MRRVGAGDPVRSCVGGDWRNHWKKRKEKEGPSKTGCSGRRRMGKAGRGCLWGKKAIKKDFRSIF